MSLLRSLFNFRSQNQGGDDAEKPFLDHLEDLRVTLMKMGTVLVISMILAFCFRNQLASLLEKPLREMAHRDAAEGGPNSPHSIHQLMLLEFSSLGVIAAEKVTGATFTPQKRQELAEQVLREYQGSPTAQELADSGRKLFEGVGGTAEEGKLQNLDITEGFSIALKLSFFAGIAMSFPFQMYFVIGFILPALTRKEKRMLGPGILAGSLLFAFGVFIGFEYILPKTLVWFHAFSNSMGFVSNWKAGTYFGFVTQLCLACGFLCELPLVMLVLSILNVISFELLQKTRRYAVAIILIIVAIISPTPDPMTFMTLAIPMLAIFEGSIWLVWLIERNRRKKELSGEMGD
jgi:sec-independent protein translocase protein TatC